METIKVESSVAYPVGTILFDEDNKKAYEVKEVRSMFLMKGDKTGYGLVLQEKEILKKTRKKSSQIRF